jgi:hypothetical protein
MGGDTTGSYGVGVVVVGGGGDNGEVGNVFREEVRRQELARGRV